MALPVVSVLSILVVLNAINCSFSIDIDERISDGSDANVVKFPYLVALRRKSCSLCAFEHFASGAIYSKNIVITAGHSVRFSTPRTLMVVVGSSYRTASDGLFYPVEKVVLHENFDPLNLDNDIALVKLKIDLPLGVLDVAQTLKIADNDPAIGSLGLVAGWGHTSEDGDYTETLKSVEVPIVSREACQKSHQFTEVTENMICAGFEQGGKDTCQGDAGSPLVVADQYIGVVSWGTGCGRPHIPGVYTNLVQLRRWIEETVRGM